MDDDHNAARQAFSALMDGEASAEEAAASFAHWHANGRSRQCWSTYHLIGDVLRSDELAQGHGDDVAFLADLNRRLVHEPTPLAPQTRVAAPALAEPQRAAPRWPWAAAAAVGGFVVVGGMMLVLRPAADGPQTLASAAAPASASEAVAVRALLADAPLVRDAQLDRYLAAHRRVANGTSVGVPGAIVRSVDTSTVDGR